MLLHTGICEVEPTPKGWFIKYIDRDPETIKRQAVHYRSITCVILIDSLQAMERKKQMDLDDEERLHKFIEKQIERANEEYPTDEPVYTELQKDDDIKSMLNHFVVSCIIDSVLSYIQLGQEQGGAK